MSNMEKKGGAELIAVVLLILIAIMIISIVTYFLLGYLNRKAGETKLLKEMSEEDLGIDSVELGADTGTSFTLTLEKGPGGQEIKSVEEGAAAPTQGIVLVSDVSGSMEWCTQESETGDKLTLWNLSTEDAFYCGKRRFNLTDCPGDKKIDSLKGATTAFINIVTNPADYPNTKLGIVEYSSGNAVEKLETSDLSVKLHVITNPGGCDEKDWMNKSFDDTTWGDYTPTISGGGCSRCKYFFRKHFTVTDLQKIESLTLSLAHREGVVCYVNGKEVYYYNRRTGGASRFPWNSTEKIPVKVLEEGDNTLACAIMTYSSSDAWGFDALLKAGNTILLDEQQPGWKYLKKTGCSPATSDYDPKNVRAARYAGTEITLLATIKNTGKPIENSFEVAFYNGTSKLLDTVTVNGIKSRELKTVKINFTDAIPTPQRKYIVEVDRGNVIPETTDANNNDSRDVYTYPSGKDLTSDIFEVHKCYNWEPTVPTTFNIRIRIYNYGTENVTESFNVTLNYTASGVLIGERRVVVPPGLILAGGGQRDVWVTLTPNPPLADPISITSLADSSNEVAELNEANNQDWETIDLRQPDLRVTSIALLNPVCSTVPNTVNVRVTVRSYDCGSLNVSSIAASRLPFTWAGNVQEIPALGADASTSRDFTLPLNLIALGSNFWIYAGVDTIENVSEAIENNNNASKSFYSGSNLKLTDFEVSPSLVDSGKSTTFKITANFSNDQCSTEEFNVTIYKDAIGGEVICRQSFSFAGAGTNSMVCSWTSALTADTMIYAFIDPENNAKEYSETDNSGSAKITVESGMASLTPFSILPIPSKLSNIFLSFKDMMIDDCGGTPVNLFTPPDSSLPRSQPLTDDAVVLSKFASDSETWWDTCICCGIKKAQEMLTATDPSGDPLYVNRAMILMSDGNATEACSGGNPKADAIAAATAAVAQNITIYAIGFGEGVDLDEATLRTISGNDPDNYTSAANKEQLLAAFEQFASAMKITYKPVTFYDHLNVVVYTKSTSYTTTRPYTDIPAPLETSPPITIDMAAEGWPITNGDITKIEIYTVALTETGKEIISPGPVAVWVKPSKY